VIVSFDDRDGVKTVVMPSETLDIIRTPFSDIREIVTCWSLAALLDILSDTAHSIDEDGSVDLCDYKNIEWSLCLNNTSVGLFTENNPVDACVKMVVKLHELNLL
jgi:hypothetical protein